MLTKIVVVVDEGAHGEYKELFEGNVSAHITATDIRGNSTPDAILTVYQDEGEENEKVIASFKEWTYWRYTK